jgi:hypothetical protein
VNNFRILALLFSFLVAVVFPPAMVCADEEKAKVCAEEEKTKACAKEEKWFISFYAGKSSSTKLIDFFKLQASYENSYISVLAGGYRFYQWEDKLALEVEGQIGQHSGMQDHQEVNALLVVRWLKFPWNKYVETSIAVGDGLSYALKTPEIEMDKEKTSRLLNYLMLEATVTALKKPKIETFVRIHHRSGIFGLVNNVYSGGSNFLCGGIRYRF